MASPSLVQSKGATTNSSTTVTVMLDSNPTENNFLIVGAAAFAPGNDETLSVTTPSGFTTAVNEVGDTAGGMNSLIAYKVAGASESTTVTVTCTSSPVAFYLWVGEYNNMPTSANLDVTSSVGDTGSTVTSRSTGTTATLAQADNLAFALFACGGTATGESYTNGFTEIGRQGDSIIATKITAATTAIETTRSWTSGAVRANGTVAIFKANSPVSAPVNTVPKSGIQTTSATTTNIATKGGATLSTIDSGGLTTARLWCTSGDITVTLSGSCTITAGSNGSSDLTIGNGASTAEFNTVLATAVYQGDADFHGKDTINFVATGGGGSDTDTYYVLNDPRTLTVTFSTTYAQGVDAVENLKANLDVGNLTGQITMVTTDSAANSDTDTVNIAAPNTVQNVHAIRKRRKRRKPSHNDRP